MRHQVNVSVSEKNVGWADDGPSAMKIYLPCTREMGGNRFLSRTAMLDNQLIFYFFFFSEPNQIRFHVDLFVLTSVTDKLCVLSELTAERAGKQNQETQ